MQSPRGVHSFLLSPSPTRQHALPTGKSFAHRHNNFQNKRLFKSYSFIATKKWKKKQTVSPWIFFQPQYKCALTPQYASSKSTPFFSIASSFWKYIASPSQDYCKHIVNYHPSTSGLTLRVHPIFLLAH